MTKRNITVVLVLVFVLGACGPYQKALKENDPQPKLKLANEYYDEGKKEGKKSRFKRSIRLLEQILPQYRGKPQGERLAFMYADSYYRIKDYFDAGYQFERFVKSYTQSEKAEEAAFKGAKSYYYISPKHSLDQTDTEKALGKLQEYISKHPDGEHVAEANQIVESLRRKLEKKEFSIAKLYYDQDDYKAAIASMNNFINENPGSPFREEAYYYRMDAEYNLAIRSFLNVMEGRLEKTKDYSEDYMKYFPEGDFLDKAESISEDVDKRLEQF